MCRKYWQLLFSEFEFWLLKINYKIHSIFLDFTFWLSFFSGKKKKLVRVPFRKEIAKKKRKKVGGGIFVNSISLVLIEFIYKYLNNLNNVSLIFIEFMYKYKY